MTDPLKTAAATAVRRGDANLVVGNVDVNTEITLHFGWGADCQASASWAGTVQDFWRTREPTLTWDDIMGLLKDLAGGRDHRLGRGEEAQMTIKLLPREEVPGSETVLTEVWNATFDLAAQTVLRPNASDELRLQAGLVITLMEVRNELERLVDATRER